MSNLSLSTLDMAPVVERLTMANQQFANNYPGDVTTRQPVHTVYGGTGPASLDRVAAAKRHD